MRVIELREEGVGLLRIVTLLRGELVGYDQADSAK